ncbi:MAG: hypothetical protein FVQ85_21915 [Planctomycetes bacterium]|nr:hypothetical protein [Planctomycetota bacterium]
MKPFIVYRLVEFSQKYLLGVILATALITGGSGIFALNKTILLAAFTPVIGFLSLVSANLSQAKQFGIELIILPAILILDVVPKLYDELNPLVTNLQEIYLQS